MKHLVKWKSVHKYDHDEVVLVVYKAEEFGYVQFETDGIKCIDDSRTIFISYSALFTVEYFDKEEKVIKLDDEKEDS